MKLTQNKIDEVIIDILGNEGLRLVKELKNKDNISEFTLATKLKRDIKVVRHMLYRLYNYNLVTSTRKKDKQKGWYIYYWTIIPDNIKFLYIKNRKIIHQKLTERLQKEVNEQFYTCPSNCVRLDFDQAMDFEFRCPECGELISQDQNPQRIKTIQIKIDQLKKEIASEEKSLSKPPKKETKKKILLKTPLKKKITKKKTPKTLKPKTVTQKPSQTKTKINKPKIPKNIKTKKKK